LQLTIYSGAPQILLNDNGKVFTLFRNKLKDIDNLNQCRIKLVKDKQATSSATLIAKIIAHKISKRMYFKRAVLEGSRALESQQIPGFKIQVSGRLGGAEIARQHWVRIGRVPLQTLNANIDYSLQESATRYGIIGVKVWIFKGDPL
jgi:small subunit ribosomal protein S3